MAIDTEDVQAEHDALTRLDSVNPDDLPDQSMVIDGDPQPAMDLKYEMGAKLQDIKLSAATNGANYDMTFEVGTEQLPVLGALAKGGHDVTFKQVGVGAGGVVRGVALTKDADDGVHIKLKMRFPQSEVRSLGRLGAILTSGDSHGKLILEPMQGSLNLADGTKVDLTKRA